MPKEGALPSARVMTAAGGAGGPGPVVSPWARLGLRRNPFGEPPPEDAGALIVAPEVEGLAEHLRRAGSAVQVLGQEGRGKTARLRALGLRFPAAPYAYLPEDGPLPELPRVGKAKPSVPALLLDEAQRLPRRRRRRLFRTLAERGATLGLASHQDLRRELEDAGLGVETTVAAGLDPERLLAIVERRLEWARLERADRPPPRPSHAQAEELIRRFGDDLRGLLDHLYEVYQERLSTGGDERWPSAT